MLNNNMKIYIELFYHDNDINYDDLIKNYDGFEN